MFLRCGETLQQITLQFEIFRPHGRNTASFDNKTDTDKSRLKFHCDKCGIATDKAILARDAIQSKQARFRHRESFHPREHSNFVVVVAAVELVAVSAAESGVAWVSVSAAESGVAWVSVRAEAPDAGSVASDRPRPPLKDSTKQK